MKTQADRERAIEKAAEAAVMELTECTRDEVGEYGTDILLFKQAVAWADAHPANIPGPSGRGSYWPAHDTKTVNEFSRILANKIENELKFGPSEGAGEKCFHGTFKDEYVHGLQDRIQTLEAEITKLREQLGVVDMSGIDTEGTSEY